MLKIKNLFRDDEGEEQEVDEEETRADTQLQAAREKLPYLKSIKKGSLAKHVKSRWDRHEKAARKVQTELKVNHARFKGNTFAQVHPTDPNRIFTPAGSNQRLPPTINKMRRTVHRYVSQVTADEPIIEGVPASHTDESRDAAEASTDVLRGEWHRMNLHKLLQRAVQIAAVFRSGFWMFQWDETAGGRSKAKKYFKNEETGEQELDFVNRAGERTDEDGAAEIWQGDIVPKVLTPMNVRWSGGQTVHDADEVIVGEIVTLRQLYESDPKTRDVKLTQLLDSVPKGAEEWLNDIRGASGLPSAVKNFEEDEIVDLDGHSVKDDDSKLDAPVMLLHYFKAPTREYKKGFHAIVAGKHTVFRGDLRYGVMPVAQFRLIEDISDPLGLSLVDLLKDPQELLDFVNGQILRFLQSMKRRWFVPLASGVKNRDLLNPTRSIIPYNPNAGAPTQEQTQEMPQTLPDILERFQAEYNDEAGINDIMKGKHVPGVSSGRHAEALRSGDETLLGLTRTQIQEGLEHAGLIILEMVKREWSSERRVEYFEGREYVEKAFAGTDLGSTATVRLKKGTLLMLTPAQKLETLFGYAEMGAINADELRRMAPLADTAGISVTEDPHYQKARREGQKFLAGPPKDLQRAREDFEKDMEFIERQLQDVQTYLDLGAEETPEGSTDSEIALARIQEDAQRITQEWQQELAKYAPAMAQWEVAPMVSETHLTQHMSDLARDKVRRFPDWWVEPFEAHVMQHMQALAPPPEEGAEGQPPAQPQQ